ncbi:helicase-related protein [Gemmobacter lanyuensis]
MIIFTEPKDTLYYLHDRVRARLGRADAVEVIHGGVSREDRRKIVERFMQDRDMLVLIANDAAGEGVNLQRGHLMVNYDLPGTRTRSSSGSAVSTGSARPRSATSGTSWRPIRARARSTPGFWKSWKLRARRWVGGLRRPWRVVRRHGAEGSLFEAIQYGEQPDVKARLFQAVDGAVDQQHLLDLLARRALTNDTMPAAKVQEIRIDMERAEAQRLQPHHIQSFFVEAFKSLGGQIKPREEGRWEITHVPVSIRERDRQIGTGSPVQKKYERICFEKGKVNQQPVATFVCPGHPLLEAVISIVREQYDHLMKQGAVMVDETDLGQELSAIFLLEHSVQDGRPTSTGKPHIISEKLQFASIDKTGKAANAGIAPT